MRGIVQNAVNELRAIDRTTLQRTGIGDARRRHHVAYENNLANSRFEVGGGAGAPYVGDAAHRLLRRLPRLHGRPASAAHARRSRRLSGAAQRVRAACWIRKRRSSREDAGAGVIPPDFAIDHGARAAQRLRRHGACADTVLVQTLVRRLPNVAEISETRSRRLHRARRDDRARRRHAGLSAPDRGAAASVRPRAVHDAGVWRLPQGAEMYAAALRSAHDDHHDAGRNPRDGRGADRAASTARWTRSCARQGMTRGTSPSACRRCRAGPTSSIPNTDAGRAQILADLNTQTRDIDALMPRAFNTLAQAQLEITRVPDYTEAGAPGGYYQRAALDGSRPGAYYINLRDTARVAEVHAADAQLSRRRAGPSLADLDPAGSAGSIPFIRSACWASAPISEGWGLYAEQLADETGRLRRRSARARSAICSRRRSAPRAWSSTPASTHKRWTREQAIQSMMEATGDQESSVTTEIERYCVWPGQACGYMVGRQAINRMRDSARTRAGRRASTSRASTTPC